MYYVEKKRDCRKNPTEAKIRKIHDTRSNTLAPKSKTPKFENRPSRMTTMAGPQRVKLF